MEEILIKIEENTAPKDLFQLTISNNTRDFIMRFNPPNLETYYSFPNINSTNNSFKYSPDNGKNWFTITIPKGSFSADEKKQPL